VATIHANLDEVGLRRVQAQTMHRIAAPHFRQAWQHHSTVLKTKDFGYSLHHSHGLSIFAMAVGYSVPCKHRSM
jgi:hypothetical protein